MSEKSKLRRILSLDGGGIRGLLTAKVLEALEEKLNEQYAKKYGAPRDKPIRLGEYFDMVSGTSTGGILTCILLCPSENDPNYPRFSAKEAVDLYLKTGKEIFSPSLSGRLPSFLSGLTGAKFVSKNIEKILKSYLHDLELKDLLKPCLITTYDIEERRAVFFTQHDARRKANENYPVWQVARSTSAAPTYFPPAYAESQEEFKLYNIDGGLFANNPTMCAVIEAMKVFRENNTMLSPQQMFIVSIGTGYVKKRYEFKKAVKWGLLKWLSPIIDIMMSGVSETVDYQLRKLFGIFDIADQYVRISPDLGRASSELDDVTDENLENLYQAGIRCAYENDALLDKIASQLIENH